MTNENAIVVLLKKFGLSADGGESWPEFEPEIERLVRTNPFAFLIGAAFDRGMRWERAWRIPWEIDRKGLLDPKRLASMSSRDLKELVSGLSVRPRWGATQGAKTLSDAANLVCERFDGDAGAIWKNSSPAEVEKTLQEIHGLGAGIASMAIRILHDEYGCFNGQERQIDIKPDVHLLRVFRRAGFIDDESEDRARKAARRLNPEFPGALDWPAWRIGQEWCRPTGPDCASCPLTSKCPKRI